MALNNPVKTYAVGDLAESAEWNTSVRDNVAFLAQPPSARVRNSGPISVPPSDVQLTFDTEEFDTDSMFASTQAARLTFNTAGKYMVGTGFEFQDVNNRVGGTLWVNTTGTTGTEIAADQTHPSSAASGVLDPAIQLVTIYAFSTGDFATVRADNFVAGSTFTVAALADSSPVFWATWLSS